MTKKLAFQLRRHWRTGVALFPLTNDGRAVLKGHRNLADVLDMNMPRTRCGRFGFTDHSLGLVLTQSIAPEPEQWQRLRCDLVFQSRRALALHVTKMHSYKTMVKHFATDGTCPNCCRIFHTRIRLCCHLRTASQCIERIRDAFPPLSAEVMDSLNVIDRALARDLHCQGWLPTKAQIPALKACGPLLPPAGSPEAQSMKSKWVARNGHVDSPAFDALEGMRVNLDSTADAQDGVEDERNSLQSQMTFVMHSSRGTEHGHGGCFSMVGLARLYAKLHIRTMCFIHKFSGYRREGDLQHQIEQHWVQGIHHVFCISIGFCLQGQAGDLPSPANIKFWKNQICSGAVLGFGGGPPCETFTAARFLEGGPPPLRSFDEPCGLASNSQKQWAQTSLGTELLRFMLEMLMYCALSGACGFLEHPAFPCWAREHRPASTWAALAETAPLRIHSYIRSVYI